MLGAAIDVTIDDVNSTTFLARGTDHDVAVCLRSFQLMVDGTRADFDHVVHPDALNREAKDEPPESRGRGPAAFYATALWLRSWFDDLAFEVHDVVADIVLCTTTSSPSATTSWISKARSSNQERSHRAVA